MEERLPILEADNVEIQFNLRGAALTAVRRASLKIYEGETLALVGESGSGKSVFSKSFIGMLDKNGRVTGGSIRYRGEELTKNETEADWLKIRGKKIAMVFQDPMTSLNPVRTVGEQIAEVLMWHFKMSHDEAKKEAISLLEKTGIDHAEEKYRQYPNEFSGGMRQRVVIACAIACRPDILICDEPTTALDVTIQAQILSLIRELQKEYRMTVLFITHDLGVVANIADRVAVMYAGQIVEYGPIRELYKNPIHPYTQALLRSLPQLGIKGQPLYSIEGAPPSLYKEIRGDAFAPRNPEAMEIDFEEEPPMTEASPGHFAKTWLLHEFAADYRESLRKKREEEAIQNAAFHEPPFDYAHAEKLLEVRDLTVSFKTRGNTLNAVDGVSFDIFKGETLSIVGESGSGKTTIGRALMRIYRSNVKGDILFEGRKINGKIDRKLEKELHLKMQMVFQDPMASLNERAKVDYIVSEGLSNFRLYSDEKDRKNKVDGIMKSVGLSPEFATRFPHEFSGGQRQRIGIARSLVMKPELVIADEPISALDVSIRAQIINLLNDMKKAYQLTYLFIAHDLSVVRFISDRIAVVYKGKIVETALTEELFARPLHPYTKALLSAVPMPDPDMAWKERPPVYDPSMHDYREDKPKLVEIIPGHFVYANDKETAAYRQEIGNES